jgi:hypothetical protein
MTNNGRFMTFLAIVLSVWTLKHLYVAARLWNLPAAHGPGWHRAVEIGTVALWLSFPLGQILSRAIGRWAALVEAIGATWVGVLFLLLTCLLAADVVTGFGWAWPSASRPFRTVAVVAALVLGAIALVQGLRPPDVRAHLVAMRGLRPEHVGLRIVQVSDLHVGPILGSRWLADRVAQVDALRPACGPRSACGGSRATTSTTRALIARCGYSRTPASACSETRPRRSHPGWCWPAWTTFRRAGSSA